MKDLLIQLWHDPKVKAAVIAFVLGAVANLANAMTSGSDEKTSWLGRMLRFMLDRSPTFLSQADSPGTLKLPFMSSHGAKRLAYHAKKVKATSMPLTVLLPIALLGLLVSGCAFGKAVGVNLASCAMGAVSDAAAPLVDQAFGSLMGNVGNPSWEDFSKTTLVSKGIDLGLCAAKAALHSIGLLMPANAAPDPKLKSAMQKADVWISITEKAWKK